MTKNLTFAHWPQVFASDNRATGALLDHLTHQVHIETIEGDGYSLCAGDKRGKNGDKSKPTT